MMRLIHKKMISISRIACLILLLFTGMTKSWAQVENEEHNIKAMFVLNFIKYVEWPNASEKNEFKIGIAGESELYTSLVNLSIKRNESGKIKIQKLTKESKESIQILLIPKSESKKIGEWIKKYEGKGVLIISEDCKSANFSAINLINVEEKIQFEINNSLARFGGVKISSKLAEMAISVHP
jgi:hypothetical protein